MTIFLDAGPALNFLATSNQNILIQVAAAKGSNIHVPERVEREILGKARLDTRFQQTPVESTWNKLVSSSRITVLSDVISNRMFEDAISRVADMPARNRMQNSKSLGEILVIAHASVLVQSGHNVFILMDDSDGRRRAKTELTWLGAQGHPSDCLAVWSTRQVLESAAGQGWIAQWEPLYVRMRRFDDGLLPR